MPKYNIKTVLKKLIDEFPRPLSLIDFSVPEEEKQELLKLLSELHQRELIDAKFQLSAMRDTHGMPLEAVGIKIRKEGREFLEPKTEQPSIVQNITINNSPGTINIAGNDVKITNSANAEKILEILLKNINDSNIKTEEKASISNSLKEAFASSAPGVFATLLIETVKSFITLNQ